MISGCKIISLPEEKPTIRRSVPPIMLTNFNALADFCLVFGGFPMLDDQAAREKSNALQKKFNFKTTSSVSTLDTLFGNSRFLGALEKPDNRGGLVYFSQELIAAGDIPKAKRWLDRLIEYSRVSNETICLRFLKIRLENNVAALFSEFSRLAQDTNFPLIVPVIWSLSIYHVARVLIGNKQFELIEPLLRKINQPTLCLNNHPLLKIIDAIIRGDTLAAQGDYRGAIDIFEKVEPHIPAALQQEPSDKVQALYQNLWLAVELQLMFAYREINQFEKARTKLESLVQRTASLPFLCFSQPSKGTLWLILGEHALAQGQITEATRFFEQSVVGHESSLHALTRLNELTFAKLAAAPKLSQERVQPVLASLEKEARLRETGEEISLLALQRFVLASRTKMTTTCRQAIDALLTATRDTTLAPLILAYYAHQPYCPGQIKREFIRTRIPDEIIPGTPIQKEIALTLFGTAKPKLLAEAARSIKRKLSESTPATQLPLATISKDEIAEMLRPYNAKAEQMRTKLAEFLAAAKRGEALIYSGDVINGFRLLDQAGISSFRIIADRQAKTARVRVTNNLGASFEQEITSDFNLTQTNPHPFFHLLTLIIIDFFLALQLEEVYEPVFSSLDFKWFAESEFLQLDRLQEQLRLLFGRVPSASERTLDSLGRQLEGESVAEALPPAAAVNAMSDEVDDDDGADSSAGPSPLEMKKQIFAYGAARQELKEGTRLRINIPKEASLIPLAKLLDVLEVKVNGQKINLTFYAGSQEINLTIDPEGNIAIVDYSRGITDFEIIRQLNEIVLDLLNAHFNSAYEATIRVADPRRRTAEFHALFEAVQDSKVARDRKREIFNLTPPAQRSFEVSQVAGQINHPFETTFFEESTGEKGRRKLIPLPAMKPTEAIEAIRAGKQIVQVGIVNLHLTRVPNPIPATRIDEYVLKHILGLNIMPEEADDEEKQQLTAKKTQILHREITADPHRFLRPDPEDPEKLTLDTILLKDGKVEKRTHHTFVRPHLAIYTMMVTEQGTLRATQGKRATRPRKPVKEQHPQTQPNIASPQVPLPPPPPVVPQKPSLHDQGLRQEAALTLSGREMLGELRAQGIAFNVLSGATGLSTTKLILIIREEENVNETELADIKRVYDSKRKVV
jgi:tetratricopeptide (TPR) repeat protein